MSIGLLIIGSKILPLIICYGIGSDILVPHCPHLWHQGGIFWYILVLDEFSIVMAHITVNPLTSAQKNLLGNLAIGLNANI